MSKDEVLLNDIHINTIAKGFEQVSYELGYAQEEFMKRLKTHVDGDRMYHYVDGILELKSALIGDTSIVVLVNREWSEG